LRSALNEPDIPATDGLRFVSNIQTSLNDISETLGIHPVTAERCEEKGKKLIGNYEGIWDILEKRT